MVETADDITAMDAFGDLERDDGVGERVCLTVYPETERDGTAAKCRGQLVVSLQHFGQTFFMVQRRNAHEPRHERDRRGEGCFGGFQRGEHTTKIPVEARETVVALND